MHVHVSTYLILCTVHTCNSYMYVYIYVSLYRTLFKYRETPAPSSVGYFLGFI
jgi:hypothetical protein